MASTYVKVTSLEDACKRFDAGLLHWYSTVQDEWMPQSAMSNASYPPTDREVAAGWWSILIEDDSI